MTQALLFKFTLAALLLIWPGAVESRFYPGPKVDKPATPIAQQTSDADVLAYVSARCWNGIATERRVSHRSRGRKRRRRTCIIEPFALPGPAAQQATSIALLEIAWHESGFRSKVEDCRITGDLPTRHSKINEGLAVSMFQLKANNREDLFEFAQTKTTTSGAIRAMLFVRATRSRQTRPSCTHAPCGQESRHDDPRERVGDVFTYASGKSGKTKAGQEHVEQFEAMMRKHGLVFVPKNGAMWVEAKMNDEQARRLGLHPRQHVDSVRHARCKPLMNSIAWQTS